MFLILGRACLKLCRLDCGHKTLLISFFPLFHERLLNSLSRKLHASILRGLVGLSKLQRVEYDKSCVLLVTTNLCISCNSIYFAFHLDRNPSLAIHFVINLFVTRWSRPWHNLHALDFISGFIE